MRSGDTMRINGFFDSVLRGIASTILEAYGVLAPPEQIASLHLSMHETGNPFGDALLTVTLNPSSAMDAHTGHYLLMQRPLKTRGSSTCSTKKKKRRSGGPPKRRGYFKKVARDV